MNTRMSRHPSFLLLVLIVLSAAASAHAQSVRWEPLQGALALGQTSELLLIFEDCSPKETPRLPKIDGLSLDFAGQSTSTSIINFTRSDSVTFTYAARLTKKQRVTIPSFEVETDKGKLRTPVAAYEPGAATVGNTGVSLENAANARLVATPTSVWVGEVFNLTYSLDASRSYFPDFGRGQIEWNGEPLVSEDWSRPEPLDFRAGSEPRTGLSYRTRAIARTPGSIRLNAVNQLLNLSVGVTGFGFFQQRQYQQFSITSATPVLEVKTLPVAPAGFNGAVGSLKLVSKIVPLTAAVGEPITWTLELSGVANWPDITGLPARAVSKNFQVVSPQAKRTPAEGKLFDATLNEDVVLVPTKAGTYTLGPVTFTYFEPKSGTYKTLITTATSVTITEPTNTPAATSGLNLNVTPNPTSGSRTDTSAKAKVVPAPLPLSLPREPLAGSALATVPLSTRTIVVSLLVALVSFWLFWLGLAYRRALRTDPLAPHRAAKARLEKLLPALNVADPAVLQTQLIAWQHDTALLLRLNVAAPSLVDLDRAAKASEALQTLWAETDRTLYSENTPLPADWPARARTSLTALPLERFSPFRLFLPSNLFPFIAALILAVLVTPANLQAEDGAADYRRGDFPAAEKSFRSALVAAPTNALAHHNLSLALAQQDRWDEAAAHASAAFVQAPDHEAIRAQFNLAAEKSGHVPPALASFLQPGPRHTLARLQSPAAWQVTLLVAVSLFLLFTAILLAWVFQPHPRSQRARSLRRLIAYPALAGSLLLTAGALSSLSAYGAATDARATIAWHAGILRSIPTEADTAQKTTPLAAGSLAAIDQSFLGWRHLTFTSGQTGWVRAEELVLLWR